MELPLAKEQFYSIFNELDELYGDYQGDFHPVLQELSIHASVIKVAYRQAEVLLKWFDVNHQTNEIVMAKEPKPIGQIDKAEHAYFTFLWLDGLMGCLLMCEQAGFAWDEIAESDIAKLESPEGNTTFKITLFNAFDNNANFKNVMFEMSKLRATNLHFDFLKQPRPMKPMLSRKDRCKMVLGAAMYSEGFMTASNLMDMFT